MRAVDSLLASLNSLSLSLLFLSTLSTFFKNFVSFLSLFSTVVHLLALTSRFLSNWFSFSPPFLNSFSFYTWRSIFFFFYNNSNPVVLWKICLQFRERLKHKYAEYICQILGKSAAFHSSWSFWRKSLSIFDGFINFCRISVESITFNFPTIPTLIWDISLATELPRNLCPNLKY